MAPFGQYLQQVFFQLGGAVCFIHLNAHKKKLLALVYMLLHRNNIELLLRKQARNARHKPNPVGTLYYYDHLGIINLIPDAGVIYPAHLFEEELSPIFNPTTIPHQR
jgi:hypothetical protein